MTDIRADFEKDAYIAELQKALIECELGSQEERGASNVEVDVEFGAHMFGAAIGWLTFETRDYSNNPAYDDGIKKAIEAYKAQQAK